MAVYHIVLFKLKPDASAVKVAEWSALGAAMVGKIPGLIKWDANRALPATENRAQGFDMGLVAVLEKPDDVLTYAQHPAHLEVHVLREELCYETLAYDFEFE
ncbi:hypothetical protein F4782DRAFT_164896 [Xylaria castorea]|nr:hypothetical protein F4782DRAFT_164896 [Xylaria castorea]